MNLLEYGYGCRTGALSMREELLIYPSAKTIDHVTDMCYRVFTRWCIIFHQNLNEVPLGLMYLYIYVSAEVVLVNCLAFSVLITCLS